jgi:hypothetical protein
VTDFPEFPNSWLAIQPSASTIKPCMLL